RLLRIRVIHNLQGMLLKEPLSLLASSSAFAVVEPIDSAGHDWSLLIMAFAEKVRYSQRAAQGVDPGVALVDASVGDVQVSALDVKGATRAEEKMQAAGPLEIEFTGFPQCPLRVISIGIVVNKAPAYLKVRYHTPIRLH